MTTTTGTDRLHFTGDDEVDRLLVSEPMALIIGCSPVPSGSRPRCARCGRALATGLRAPAPALVENAGELDPPAACDAMDVEWSRQPRRDPDVGPVGRCVPPLRSGPRSPPGRHDAVRDRSGEDRPASRPPRDAPQRPRKDWLRHTCSSPTLRRRASCRYPPASRRRPRAADEMLRPGDYPADSPDSAQEGLAGRQRADLRAARARDGSSRPCGREVCPRRLRRARAPISPPSRVAAALAGGAGEAYVGPEDGSIATLVNAASAEAD